MFARLLEAQATPPAYQDEPADYLITAWLQELRKTPQRDRAERLRTQGLDTARTWTQTRGVDEQDPAGSPRQGGKELPQRLLGNEALIPRRRCPKAQDAKGVRLCSWEPLPQTAAWKVGQQSTTLPKVGSLHAALSPTGGTTATTLWR